MSFHLFRSSSIISVIFSVFSVLVLHFFLTFISMDFIILCSCGCNYCWNWIFYISHICQSCLTHFINCNSFVVDLAEFYIQRSYYLQIQIVLNLPFNLDVLFHVLVCNFSSRIYHTLLNRSDEGEIHVFVLLLRKHVFLPLNMKLIMEFLLFLFIKLNKFYSALRIVIWFIMKLYWLFVIFLHFWGEYVNFVILFYKWGILINFSMLKQP